MRSFQPSREWTTFALMYMNDFLSRTHPPEWAGWLAKEVHEASLQRAGTRRVTARSNLPDTDRPGRRYPPRETGTDLF